MTTDFEIGHTYELWEWSGTDAKPRMLEYLGSAPSSGTEIFTSGVHPFMLDVQVWGNRDEAIGFGVRSAEVQAIFASSYAHKVREHGTALPETWEQ